jgi:phosphate starvation-inducible protein PhoH
MAANVQDLLRRKEQITRARDTHQQLIGQQNQLLKTLQEKYKVKTNDEGRRLLARIRQTIAGHNAQLEKQEKAFREKYPV